ncbi:hypothetical protein Nmel_017040 [Mimus melanotis]
MGEEKQALLGMELHLPLVKDGFPLDNCLFIHLPAHIMFACFAVAEMMHIS